MRLLMFALTLAVTASPITSSRAQAPTPIKYRPDLLIQVGVSNLDRAIAFYTGPLGFRLEERRDDLKFAHIDTNVPGLQVGLNEIASPQGSGSIVLNIGVANVKEARAQLEGRGVRFRGETVIIPGKVALAEFADPDNNVWRLAGPPPAKPAGQQ